MWISNIRLFPLKLLLERKTSSAVSSLLSNHKSDCHHVNNMPIHNQFYNLLLMRIICKAVWGFTPHISLFYYNDFAVFLFRLFSKHPFWIISKSKTLRLHKKMPKRALAKRAFLTDRSGWISQVPWRNYLISSACIQIPAVKLSTMLVLHHVTIKTQKSD